MKQTTHFAWMCVCVVTIPHINVFVPLLQPQSLEGHIQQLKNKIKQNNLQLLIIVYIFFKRALIHF